MIAKPERELRPMKMKVLLPLFVLFCASVFAQEAKPKIIAIKAGRLIDGLSNAVINHAFILIEGDKITIAH